MEKRRLTKIIIVLVVIAFCALLIYALLANRRAGKAETNLPYETAKVVDFNLKRAASIHVTAATGNVVATGDDEGWGGFLHSRLRCRFPFSVDYSIELSKVTSANYRWDSNARTMLVEIPDVTFSAPNIDETKGQCEKAKGWWVTVGASNRLHQLVSRLSDSAARAEAAKPTNLQKARLDARRTIEEMLSAPLAAAGLGQVSVTVRFPFERGGTIGERWNASTPLSEIYDKR